MSRAIAPLVLATLLSGCSASKDPRGSQLESDYNDQIRQLDEWRAKSLQDCEHASDPQNCRAQVLKKYNDSKLELIEWRSKQQAEIMFPRR